MFFHSIPLVTKLLNYPEQTADIDHAFLLSWSVKKTIQNFIFNKQRLHMLTTQIYKEYTVYPGEYIPLPEVNALLSTMQSTNKISAARPSVNVDEYKDYYKIEVMVYGVKREDILINVNENILSILALQKESEDDKKNQLHEFSHDCFDRHILLPDNTDSQLIIAEYQSGILTIYVPKSTDPVMNVHTRIVVY